MGHIDDIRDFYAVRWHRLRDLLVRHGIWDEACAIMANGKASPTEPPTYAVRLESLKDGALVQLERVRAWWLQAERAKNTA